MCRQLGYIGAVKYTQESAFGSVLGPFSYNNVKCHGNEESISDCPHLGTSNCDVNEGAGVVCNPTMISTTTTIKPMTITAANINSTTGTTLVVSTTSTSAPIKSNFIGITFQINSI